MSAKSPALKIMAMSLVITIFSGCSSIIGRQRDETDVMFDSSLSDVEVRCSGKSTLTPGTIALRQSKSHTCTARREGYKPSIIKIPSGISWRGFAQSTITNAAAWGWWTLGIGVGIGWIVDLPTGAMRDLKVEEVNIVLEPERRPSETQEAAE